MPDANAMYDEANKLKDSGDLEGAVAKLEEILTFEPNHVLTHQALAVYCQRLHQADKAIAHANKVCELEPNDSFSYTQLSVILQRCGKIQEAEDAMARGRMMQGH
jgi:Flp pilus assembly protein TadD